MPDISPLPFRCVLDLRLHVEVVNDQRHYHSNEYLFSLR